MLLSNDAISLVDDNMVLIDLTSEVMIGEFTDSYGLLTPEETILVRAYSDDTDDRMLDEIKPKFIVMFEPDMDFVRRIEVPFNCNCPMLAH
jgi:DNA excision repair protein ERCC-4